MYLSTFLTTLLAQHVFVHLLLVDYFRKHEDYLCYFCLYVSFQCVLDYIFQILSTDFVLDVQRDYFSTLHWCVLFLSFILFVLECVCVFVCVRACVFYAGARRKISHCSIYWQWSSLCNSECMFVCPAGHLPFSNIYVVYIRINMCVYMRVYIYVYIHTYVCINTHMYMYVDLYILQVCCCWNGNLFGRGSPNSFLVICSFYFAANRRERVLHYRRAVENHTPPQVCIYQLICIRLSFTQQEPRL